MIDVLLAACLTALTDGDHDTARELANMAGDDEAVSALLAEDVEESYTEAEYAVLTEADRSHLVAKKVTVRGKNGKSHQAIRYVRVKDKPKAKPKRDKDVIKGVALERAGEMIRKGVKTPAEARELAGHLKTLSVSDIAGLKKEHAARTGGRLKQDQVDRLVAYAQGRGSVPSGAGKTAPATHPEAKAFMRQQARRLVSAWADADRLGQDQARNALEVVLGNMSGVEQVGEKGDTIPFSPVHHDSKDAASSGKPVVVERPGWVLREPDGTEYVVAKAVVSAGGKPAAKLLLSQPDAEIAAKVLETGENLKYGFGENKVFVSDLYDELKKEDPSLTEDGFKQKLLALNRSDHLTLSRADLVQVMDPESVRRSEIEYLNATFHLVLLPDKKGRKAKVNRGDDK